MTLETMYNFLRRTHFVIDNEGFKKSEKNSIYFWNLRSLVVYFTFDSWWECSLWYFLSWTLFIQFRAKCFLNKHFYRVILMSSALLIILLLVFYLVIENMLGVILTIGTDLLVERMNYRWFLNIQCEEIIGVIGIIQIVKMWG